MSYSNSNGKPNVGVVHPLSSGSESDKSEDDNQTRQDDANLVNDWYSKQAQFVNKKSTQNLESAESHQPASGQETCMCRTSSNNTKQNGKQDTTKRKTKKHKSKRMVARACCCFGWIVFCPCFAFVQCMMECPDFDDDDDIYGDLLCTPVVVVTACCGERKDEKDEVDDSTPC